MRCRAKAPVLNGRFDLVWFGAHSSLRAGVCPKAESPSRCARDISEPRKTRPRDMPEGLAVLSGIRIFKMFMARNVATLD